MLLIYNSNYFPIILALQVDIVASIAHCDIVAVANSRKTPSHVFTC